MMDDKKATDPPKKIAHIGIAVKKIAHVLDLYTNTLNLQLEKIEEVPTEGVKVAFLKIGETRIELLEPLHNQSPIFTFIERKGEGIHHIALEVDHIDVRLTSMKENGIQLINEQAKQGANGAKVAFLHPKSTNGVLFELCEHKDGD
jgi:methylmalonyl-CoA epimerase